MTLAAFGHPVEDKQLKEDALERNGVPTLKIKMTKQKNVLKFVMTAKKNLHSAIKMYQDLDFLKGRDFENSKQMFEAISNRLTLMSEVCPIIC